MSPSVRVLPGLLFKRALRRDSVTRLAVNRPLGLPLLIRSRSSNARTTSAFPGNRPVKQTVLQGSRTMEPLAGTPPVIDPEIERRLREHIERSKRAPKWHAPSPAVNAFAFGMKYGFGKVREEICRERQIRREVLAAKGQLGRSGMKKPERTWKSWVPC